MPESKEPMTTKRVQATEARQDWSELLNSVFEGNTRVIVERSGIPIAAIVSTQDLEALERADKERLEAERALREFGQAFRDRPPEEIEEEVAKAVAEVRRERQTARQRGIHVRSRLSLAAAGSGGVGNGSRSYLVPTRRDNLPIRVICE